MAIKFKGSLRIILSAIFTKVCSFRNMMKPNLCEKSIIFGSPPKRATWEGKSGFFGKNG